MATQNTERRVVTNRVFLLGLDELYRAAMKKHERTELLQSAKEVSSALSLPPANVPIEGYYGEDAQLTEYFRIVRALQQVRKERESEVAKLQSFKRLKQITSSPIFGPTSETPYLFSAGKDPLTVALENTLPDDWSLENLTQLAFD
ncbi:MAG TPA: hypothetical protein PK402_12335, partial [Tepidisphaeraceae bacterium]|nr:hypothetical protein [Tepidisphaeraceae bacterium]